VKGLISDKDLEKALGAVSTIYITKRKKIKLDSVSIEEVQKKYSGTVELLNEYLKDDGDEENNPGPDTEGDLKIRITQSSNSDKNTGYVDSISFTPIQEATLDIFVKSNFSVLQSEMEGFAKLKGVFKNQLIESINEVCFDNLNDVLIEEEDDHYIIDQNNYKLILARDGQYKA
jgi:hypothetical protein